MGWGGGGVGGAVGTGLRTFLKRCLERFLNRCQKVALALLFKFLVPKIPGLLQLERPLVELDFKCGEEVILGKIAFIAPPRRVRYIIYSLLNITDRYGLNTAAISGAGKRENRIYRDRVV